MERKPIKRSPYILPLSKDHHFSLLFCWKIRQGLQLNVAAHRMQKYVEYFWQHHMQQHFREEEEILFAPLKDQQVQKAIDEHRQIAQHLQQCVQANEEEALQLLPALADSVDAHVRYEERTLFPHLEASLTEDQLQAIGKQLDQQPPVEDKYEDEFWLRQKPAGQQ